jgi:SAM-dependent methyltransferase
MPNEKYYIDIGEKGSISLDRLDYCFNKTTQEFLNKSGLKSGMTVCDIGCGAGMMTAWIAEQVGPEGKVIAIENDENQLNAARKNLQKFHNIEFKLCSVYDIETLKQQFDLVYCRFVLHHLQHPTDAIKKIFNVLKTNGIFVSEEGIVDYAFSYPFSKAWGDELLRCPLPWQDIPEGERDGNIGLKMYHKMHAVGFKSLTTKIIHPLLITRQEKNLLMIGREEHKNYFLEMGFTEQEWVAQGEELKRMINDNSQILGFFASCQVSGIK